MDERDLFFEAYPDPAIEYEFLRKKDSVRVVVKSVNVAFEETFGYEEEKFEGIPLIELPVSEEVEDIFDIREELKWELDMLSAGDDENYSFELLVSSEGEEGFAYADMVEDYREGVEKYGDIIERRRREMEDIHELLNHNLRNTATALDGWLQKLVDADTDQEREQAAQYLEKSIGQLKSISKVSDELEDHWYGNIEAVENLSLSRVSKEVYEDLGIEADLKVEDDKEIKADEEALEFILTKLYENSVNHGGEELDTIRIGKIGRGFYFEDNGQGLKEDIDQEKLFAPGMKTSVSRSGVGLKTVKKIAKEHSWNIEADNSVAGLRFEFRQV